MNYSQEKKRTVRIQSNFKNSVNVALKNQINR